VVARETRWSGWRYEVESIIFVWQVLVLLGAFIHAEDFKPGGTWFYVAEATAILALLGLYTVMEVRRRRIVVPGEAA
jgi:hypothetical protein